MNWFTDKLYDRAASPRAGEGAWSELAAQDAMSPATRASYYAGSEMPPDPRNAGWRSEPRMGDTVAPPGTADWMAPPEGPARVDAPSQQVARRFGESSLTPPPARSAADAYRMSGMAAMDQYKPNTFREIDRQAIEDQYGGADIHGIKLPPVSLRDEPKAWFDTIVGETPADALVNWGLGGTGKLARGALALGGLFKLADPAEAGALSKLRGALPMDEASRMKRAAEQGYTIDAYKGWQAHDWDTIPVRSGSGRIIKGADRVPRELTEVNNPREPYAGFFSSDPAVADRFGQYEGGGTLPAKLKFENPLVIDAKGEHAAAFQFPSIARERGTTKQMEQFRKAFDKDSPHDGVILRGTRDEGDVYVPRTPQQIRSRWAAFDPANASSGNLLGSVAGLMAVPIGLASIAAQDKYNRGD